MKRVILCPNPYRDNELTVAKRSRQLLEQIGFETVVCLPFSREGYGDQLGAPIRQLQQEIMRADLLIAFGGDGGTYDIGFQSLSGAMERGHDMVYVCYDNEAYMNTGMQRSSSTPRFASATTTPVTSTPVLPTVSPVRSQAHASSAGKTESKRCSSVPTETPVFTGARGPVGTLNNALISDWDMSTFFRVKRAGSLFSHHLVTTR